MWPKPPTENSFTEVSPLTVDDNVNSIEFHWNTLIELSVKVIKKILRNNLEQQQQQQHQNDQFLKKFSIRGEGKRFDQRR